MEKPEKVIHDDQYTGRYENGGHEGNEGPAVREVLKIQDVADDGEHSQFDWEVIGDAEQNV